jgi:hypothetical protein
MGGAKSTETDIGSLVRFYSSGCHWRSQAASALAVRSDRYWGTIGVVDWDLPV